MSPISGKKKLISFNKTSVKLKLQLSALRTSTLYFRLINRYICSCKLNCMSKYIVASVWIHPCFCNLCNVDIFTMISILYFVNNQVLARIPNTFKRHSMSGILHRIYKWASIIDTFDKMVMWILKSELYIFLLGLSDQQLWQKQFSTAASLPLLFSLSFSSFSTLCNGPNHKVIFWLLLLLSFLFSSQRISSQGFTSIGTNDFNIYIFLFYRLDVWLVIQVKEFVDLNCLIRFGNSSWRNPSFLLPPKIRKGEVINVG